MLRRPALSAPRATVGAGAAAVVLVLALCGCGPAAPPGTSASPAPPPATPATSATSVPEGGGAPSTAAPEYLPDGTAADNLRLFASVTAAVWASDQRASGRAYIDALVAAGFDRSAMQVTKDVTTVGNPVESLQFSVRWGATECLIGQVGPSTGAPVATVMPQLAEGRCLVGSTRAIDW